jgi:shikimate kinase
MTKPKRIFIVGHMGASKTFLEKQHRERDAFYEDVATLIIESVGYSDQVSEIDKFVEEDVSPVMKAFEE